MAKKETKGRVENHCLVYLAPASVVSISVTGIKATVHSRKCWCPERLHAGTFVTTCHVIVLKCLIICETCVKV